MNTKLLILFVATSVVSARGEEALKPIEAGDNSAYYEVVGQKIPAATIAKEQAEHRFVTLAELNPIRTLGLRTVRVFVQVLHFDRPKGRSTATNKATAVIRVSHNTQSGSTPYAVKDFSIPFGVGGSGFIEAPVLGPTLRITVDGENLPNTDAQVITTIYLVR